MNFLIDSGSSRIKWACLEPSQQPSQIHHTGHLAWTATDMPTKIQRAWQHLPQPNRIIGANVSGATEADTLNAAALTCWPELGQDDNIEWAQSQSRHNDLANGYQNPDQLGVDRWLSLIGARQITQDTCCIIDCGTAITLDAISTQGQHLGGLIAPGLATMHAALTNRTHNLAAHMTKVIDTDPQQTTQLPANYWANNTRDAIHGGILSALIALVDDFIKKTAKRESNTPHCFITGGDAPNLLPLLQHACQHEPQLVLKGLACLAEKTP